MLYYFLYPLRDFWFGFNIFRYVTFRTAFAAISAFLLCVIFGPPLIRLLTVHKVGEKTFRRDAPTLQQFHGKKAGTPTMGGILIVASILISTLLWARLDNSYVWMALASTLWLGIIGFVDDYIKLVRDDVRGLRTANKFMGQIVAGFIVAIFVYLSASGTTLLYFPFFKNLIIDLGIFYIPFVVIVIVGSSNAVNLTDGLDGLAVGCITMIAATYSALSYVTGHLGVSAYLGVPFIPQAAEISVFCAAIVGASLGFLWFNSHPASVFMGDTGSLALGGAIGAVAVLIKKEILLALVGGVFVVEALSVIMQVASFKLRKKRIFLMAPIHHHFQLKGWHESKITIRFWIVSAVLALLTLVTLKLM
ncbi:MAG: phospho-N-acetylmuramoyl-pentapeptide-transferase [Candidatus Omnitrophica bacterium]|nr:phospho-N-acetylmuramoyl-pentapeptide-transferase [Candidatus Omnitrophota bacterium]